MLSLPSVNRMIKRIQPGDLCGLALWDRKTGTCIDAAGRPAIYLGCEDHDRNSGWIHMWFVDGKIEKMYYGVPTMDDDAFCILSAVKDAHG